MEAPDVSAWAIVGRPFVPSEIVQIDKADRDLLECYLNPRWVAILEFHPCQRTDPIDAAGGNPQAS